MDGTASAPAKYIASQGSVTWLGHQSGEKRFLIPLVDNLTFDSMTDFKVVLTRVTGAQLGQVTESTAYILEDQPHIGPRNEILTDFAKGVAVLQGENEVVITMERSGGTDGKMILKSGRVFEYSAKAGVDFGEVPQREFIWAPGETGAKSFTIPLMASGATEPRIFQPSLAPL